MMDLQQDRRSNPVKGQATLELAMLFPVLFVFCLSLVQLVIYLQGVNVTRYAAFAAARAFQVYGDRKLADIGYPHVRELPYTNNEQTIAEATAEKIIFESLLWEQQKITSTDGLHRYYSDGIHHEYDQVGTYTNQGAVYVNFLGCTQGNGCAQGIGTEVLYCLPIVFPGANLLLGSAKKRWPCTGKILGREYKGLAIQAKVLLGREPVQ